MTVGPALPKGRALRLLGAREHSRERAERKLAPHEEEPGQLGRVLDELQAKGFIDEQRVARVGACTGARPLARRASARSCRPRDWIRSWWPRQSRAFESTNCSARARSGAAVRTQPADAARAGQAGPLPGGAGLSAGR